MSAEAPLRLYISPLTRPYTIPYRRAQTFDDFRTTANRILVSCIETGELQAGCSESVPQPNNWNVVEETGAIVSSVLWQDLVVPGGTYCLLPRQEIAAMSNPMRTSQSHISNTESTATTRSRSTTAISSASISPVSSSLGSVSSVVSGNEIRGVSYRDALSTAAIGTGRPISESNYSFFGGDDESGVRLGSESPSSSCSRPVGKRDDNHTHTQPQPQDSHSMLTTRSLVTSGSPWSTVVANGLSLQQSHHQTQQHNSNVHPTTNSNNNSDPRSTAVNDWKVVQRKPTAQPAMKPLVQIKVWKNETVPSSAKSWTVPATISVGEFIERIGGCEGCRVQEMKRIREGFLPGLTYMWGTQKSIEDVGWADRKRGTVGVYLRMP